MEKPLSLNFRVFTVKFVGVQKLTMKCYLDVAFYNTMSSTFALIFQHFKTS